MSGTYSVDFDNINPKMEDPPVINVSKQEDSLGGGMSLALPEFG